jgi:hypothetical protein
MPNMISKKLLLTLSVALYCTSSASATTIKRDGVGDLLSNLAKSVTESVSLEGLNVMECGRFEVWFDKTNGDLRSLVLKNPGPTLQAEASLCDAIVCYGSPDISGIEKIYLDNPVIVGKSSTGTNGKHSEKGLIKIRKIPLAVTERYPALFSKEEIASADNLVSLNIRHDLVKEVWSFRKPLLEFFKTHKTATKAELNEDVVGRLGVSSKK